MRITAAEAHELTSRARERHSLQHAARLLDHALASIRQAADSRRYSTLFLLGVDATEGERDYVMKELRNAGFVVQVNAIGLDIYWEHAGGQADQLIRAGRRD